LKQRKLVILGLVVLAFAAAGYFRFTMTGTKAAAPQPEPIASAPAQPVSPPAAEPAPAPALAEQPAQGQTKTAASKTSSTRAKAETQTLPTPVKTIGSKTAPITLEVFSDYQCPTCGAFYEQTLRPIINDYVAAGKVYLVHRDFPLPMHTYGYEAARWVNAASRIGKFEEVEAALYDNQKAWTVDGNIQKYVDGALGQADFKRVQKLMVGCGIEVKPGPENASACPLDGNIESDKQLGNLIPVKGTPTFVTYYKGQKYPAASGLISWPVMKQYFDSLLAQ
jgi:protein-disulfide isomerase